MTGSIMTSSHYSWQRQCPTLILAQDMPENNVTVLDLIVQLFIICKIWGFHGDDYAGNRLLGSCAVYFWLEPTFRRNERSLLPTICRHLLTIFSLRFNCPDDGGDTFLRNVGSNQKYTAQDPRRWFPAYSSFIWQWSLNFTCCIESNFRVI
jgi:hypothetical protein